MRSANTRRNGMPWNEPQKWNVWQKGRLIPGLDPNNWRYDTCGRTMKYSDYGNRNSSTGWEIDHITAVANGGNDDIHNLQPLNWENNARKGDTLNWSCPSERRVLIRIKNSTGNSLLD